MGDSAKDVTGTAKSVSETADADSNTKSSFTDALKKHIADLWSSMGNQSTNRALDRRLKEYSDDTE